MSGPQSARKDRDHVQRTLVQSARGYKDTPRGRILVDLSVVKRPIHREERTSLHRLPDTQELRPRQHAVVISGPDRKHTKREVGMSFSKSSAKVMPRMYATPRMAGKDRSAMSPDYQVTCLRAKIDRIVKQAANHLVNGRKEQYAKACSAIADLRGHIAYLCYRYPDIATTGGKK